MYKLVKIEGRGVIKLSADIAKVPMFSIVCCGGKQEANAGSMSKISLSNTRHLSN